MHVRFVKVSVRTGMAAVAAVFIGHAAASAASAENGQKAYTKYGCWQCHGWVAQGGAAGPKLAPDPIPQETFVTFVRTTNRAMPPYHEAVLPDSDLADIYAYLQTIPKGPDPKSIPLLNQ